jgi:nucleotide-binding universal stress UspA family protein
VHAWRLPLYEGVPGAFLLEAPLEPTPPLDEVRQALQEAAERLVTETLRAVAGDGGPGIEVRREVVEATPAPALIELAEGADLLVVGSRGRGGFRGLHLGSVGSQCAHHAPCPVAIVPRGHR